MADGNSTLHNGTNKDMQITSGLVLLGKVAGDAGREKNCVWRHARRKGYTLHEVVGTHGRPCQALSMSDAQKVIQHYRRAASAASGVIEDGETADIEDGTQALVFYVIQVMPDVAPLRVKLGFTSSIEARLLAFQTVTPTASVLRTFSCRPTWERAVIASVTREGCKRIGEEVFDVESLEDLLARAEAFFAIMPAVV